MADEQKEAKKMPKPSITENAAREYGLEDHEATQQDPRVNEMRRADSQHASKTANKNKPGSPHQVATPTSALRVGEPERPASNVATTYGLEGRKADHNDPRVTQILSQGQPERQPAPSEAPPPSTNAINKLRSSLKRGSLGTPTKETNTPPPPPPPPPPPASPQSQLKSPAQTQPQSPPKSAPESGAGTPYKTPYDTSASATSSGIQETRPRKSVVQPQSSPSPPPPPPPPPTPNVPLEAEAPPPEKPKKPAGINKFTNTDVSFDPSKEYASKTTNTAGEMYSEEEMTDSSASTPPPKPRSTELDLDECFAFAVGLVRRAGAFALVANKAKERLSYTTKEHEHDLNTRTDNEVEDMLVKEINQKYPTHKIIAEEAVSRSETGQVTLTDSPTWIIDPIDGTMNFVHHFPYYCISVALLVKKDTSFGIVYNPPLQEMYTARAGQGAKLNDENMTTSGQDSLKNSMILQEYSSGMNEARTTTALENANRLIKKTHALRSIGSSAMGLAMVASGVADGFYFFGLHVWDMAAGNLLVTEAGGTVMDPAGGEVDIMSRRVLAAATQTLAFQLSAELIQNYPKPRDDESRLRPEPAPAPVPIPPPVPAPVPEPVLPPPPPPPPPPPAVEPPKKDFNAQTEFSDSTMSLSSSETSRHSVVKGRN